MATSATQAVVGYELFNPGEQVMPKDLYAKQEVKRLAKRDNPDFGTPKLMMTVVQVRHVPFTGGPPHLYHPQDVEVRMQDERGVSQDTWVPGSFLRK
jgi:hypothetical protein